ncbi:unnamed protein product, partial [Rotaria sp. Silwood1]
GNNRIMCWPQGATRGSIIIGGNGYGNQSNKLSGPIGLSFDREGNLYVLTYQCSLCKTGDLDCSNQGWGAISQHMKTKGHIENIKLLKTNSTFSIESSKADASCNDDAITTAQLRLNS